MKDRCLVVETEEKIKVVPLITDACLNCKNGCAKQGTPFAVGNSKGFDLQKGDLVFIEASKVSQTVQGLVSLLVPFACAVAGFFISFFVNKKFNVPEKYTEALQVLFVLGFLVISAGCIYFFSRKFKNWGKPEVVEKL